MFLIPLVCIFWLKFVYQPTRPFGLIKWSSLWAMLSLFAKQPSTPPPLRLLKRKREEAEAGAEGGAAGSSGAGGSAAGAATTLTATEVMERIQQGDGMSRGELVLLVRMLNDELALRGVWRVPDEDLWELVILFLG